jgi:hypothetical protein
MVLFVNVFEILSEFLLGTRMQFVVEQHFDRPVGEVMDMMSDRGYFEQKFPEIGATDVRVFRCNKTSDNFEIQYAFRSRPDADLPDIAKKFVSGDLIVKQTDSLNLKTGKGTLKIELGSLPVTVGADMSLEATPKGCVNRVTWNIKVSIPLIGGKLEKILADDVRSKSVKDHKVSIRLLEQYKA